MSMDFWDLPGSSPEPEPESTGFAEAMQALEERRYQELGRLWRRAPERVQRAEARRRARSEMARRIAQHTKKKPLADRTIARRVREDKPPEGIDKTWLDRWATIDRAGGIKNLADQIGAEEHQVRRWRDSTDRAAELPRRLPPPGVPVAGAQTVGVEVEGYVVINGKEYPRRIPSDPDADYDLLVVDPAGDLMVAYYSGDDVTLKELLGDEIAMQIIIPTWTNLPATYRVNYLVEDLLQFRTDL